VREDSLSLKEQQLEVTWSGEEKSWQSYNPKNRGSDKSKIKNPQASPEGLLVTEKYFLKLICLFVSQ
jgi:hypothetical protein